MRSAWNKLEPAERKRRKALRDAAYRASNKATIRAKKRAWHGLPEPTRPEPTVCECCGQPPGKKGLNLDHNHSTGKFRGWLCGNCNTAIGKLGDNLEGVLKAVAYLGRLA